MQTNWIGRSEGAEIRFTARIPEADHRAHGERREQKRRRKDSGESAKAPTSTAASHEASTSSQVDSCDAEEVAIPVFTIRPDTIFGLPVFVLAPEHPLLGRVPATDQRH